MCSRVASEIRPLPLSAADAVVRETPAASDVEDRGGALRHRRGRDLMRVGKRPGTCGIDPARVRPPVAGSIPQRSPENTRVAHPATEPADHIAQVIARPALSPAGGAAQPVRRARRWPSIAGYPEAALARWFRTVDSPAVVPGELDEVRQSQARIQAAADTERRRIERNLHDGAQQRLIAIGSTFRSPPTGRRTAIPRPPMSFARSQPRSTARSTTSARSSPASTRPHSRTAWSTPCAASRSARPSRSRSAPTACSATRARSRRPPTSAPSRPSRTRPSTPVRNRRVGHDLTRRHARLRGPRRRRRL